MPDRDGAGRTISVIGLFGGLVGRVFDGLPVPLPVPCRGLWQRERKSGLGGGFGVSRAGTAVLMWFRFDYRSGDRHGGGSAAPRSPSSIRRARRAQPHQERVDA
jgi:hypothetical protein